MEAFKSERSHRGPRCALRDPGWKAWRSRGAGDHRDREHSMADLVNRSLARRSSLTDKPTGVPQQIPEAMWLDFPGGCKSIWRVQFNLQYDLKILRQPEEWKTFRQDLIQAVRNAVRSVLLPSDGKVKPVTPLRAIAVEGLKLCHVAPGEPRVLATLFIEAGDVEGTTVICSALKAEKTSESFRKPFATAMAQCGRTVSKVRVRQELPEDIELRGGLGEDFFVVSVPDGRLRDLGLCEGYQLHAVLRKDAQGRTSCEEGRALRAMGRDVLTSKRLGKCSVRLCFQSPFAQLPRFSEKQLADRLGFGKVRELHFHRLVLELKFAWTEVQVSKRQDLEELQESVSRDESGEGGLVISDALNGLQTGWKLRWPKSLNFLELNELEAIQLGQLPLTLEAGRPRDVRKVSLKVLQVALRRAGIHWVQEAEEMILLDVLQQERNGDELVSWEEDLADVFVIDSAGNFKRVSGPGVRLFHVFHATRKIQETLATKKSATAGMMDIALTKREFANILDGGGLNWLTQEQIDTIYRSIAGEDQEAGISLNDWMCRFTWDPMQAATELENVFQVWERRLERRSQLLLRRRSHKADSLKPKSMSFWSFHGILTEMGVDWLSLKQQRLLFRSLDSNRDGRIDTEELQALSKKRGQIELWREELEEVSEAPFLEEDTEEEFPELPPGDEVSAPEPPAAPAFDGMPEATEATEATEAEVGEAPHVEAGEAVQGDLDGDADHDAAATPPESPPSPALYDDEFDSGSPLSPLSPSSPSHPGDAEASATVSAASLGSEAPPEGVEGVAMSAMSEASASEYGEDFEDRAQVNALVAEK